VTLDPKATHPLNGPIIRQAGNLAVLCLRLGALGHAVYLAEFQRISWHEPMLVGDPLLPGIVQELRALHNEVQRQVDAPNSWMN
jgi:hypothetical protein